VNPENFVAESGNERQNWKFRADITGRRASPIDLWKGKMKSIVEIISGYRRDIGLAPAPGIDKWLSDRKKWNCDCRQRYRSE
jgi:hypothetical protein